MAPTAAVKEQLATFARDLVNLEINTLLKDNMSSTKMPPVRHAMIDIGKSYRIELVRMGGRPVWDADPSLEENAGSWRAFDLYREEAKRLHAEIELALADLPPEIQAQRVDDLYLLTRIKEISDQLKGILNRYDNNEYSRLEIEDTQSGPPALELNADDLVRLRKAWEIGVERVVAQTVVQMDGDVITRVSPRLSAAHEALVLKVHGQSVEFSVSFWSELVRLVKDSLQSLLNLLPWR